MCAQTSFLLPTIWKSQLLLQSYKCLVYILWGLCRVEYVLQDVCWASFNSFSTALCTGREGAGRPDAVPLGDGDGDADSHLCSRYQASNSVTPVFKYLIKIGLLKKKKKKKKSLFPKEENERVKRETMLN